MAINLNHYKSAIEIPVGATPDTPASGGVLFVKTDGKLYFKDTTGADFLADGSNIPEADSQTRGFDFTGVSSTAIDTESISSVMSDVKGAHYDPTNNRLYLVGTCAYTEEVPDPNFEGASLTGWTLTNNSVFSSVNDQIILSGGNTFGISFDTNAVVSRQYTVTYRRSGGSTDSVAPVVGGQALTAQTYDNTYTETVTALTATSLFSVTGTVSDNDIQFELVSVYHTTATPEGIREFEVTTLDGTTLTLTNRYQWFDLTTITEAGGITFKSDGTKAIVGSRSDDNVYEIDFSTAWQLDTGTQEGTPFDPTEATAINHAKVDPTGRFLYVAQNHATTETIYQYEMSTAWDLDTASYTTQNSGNTLYAYTNQNYEFEWSDDGRKLYILDTSYLYQFDVTDPWQIDSLVYEAQFGTLTNRHGLWFAENGTKAVVGIGASGNTLWYHILPGAGIVKRATETQEGITRLATSAEVLAEKSTHVAVTPWALGKWALSNGPAITEDAERNIVGGSNSRSSWGAATNDVIAIGANQFQGTLTTVTDSVFIGNGVMSLADTASPVGLIAIGFNAMSCSVSNGAAPGNYTIGIGHSAGTNAKHVNGIYIGQNAGLSASGGSTGDGVIAIGKDALRSMSGTITDTIAMGERAGYLLFGTSNNNIIIGDWAASNTGGSSSQNVVLGADSALHWQLGSGNLFLGYGAGPTVNATINNEMYINNIESDTPLIHGYFDAHASGPALDFNGDLTLNSGYQLFADDGAAANPAIAFSSDPDTGIYLKATANLAMSSGGTNLMELTSNGVQINQQIFFDAEVANGTGTAINWTNGNKQTIAPTAATSPTYTFSAPSGPTNLTLRATNLGAVTAVTWPAAVKWPGGTEPTWTSSGTDIISFYFDGTNYHGSASINSS